MELDSVIITYDRVKRTDRRDNHKILNEQSLVIGGDFNFPGLDWRTKSIKAGAAYTGLHHRFFEIIDNIRLVHIMT